MKSKTKKKTKNKRKVKAQGNKFSIWLEKHWIVEAFLNYLVLIVVAIGVGYLTFGNESIPAPLREFKYVSPLYINLVFLIVLPYYSWFGSLREEGFNTLKGFSEVFLYLNGLLFLLHYFIGIRSKDGKHFASPLISLDSDCNLYPIFFNSWACNSYCYLFRKEEEILRSQKTILTNICLVEDKARGKVLMQYRSPERYPWSGYAFPGGHIEKGESLHDSVVREILEETGLTITHPKLVGVKNWHTDEGIRYIVFCYKATEFSGQIHSTEEGEISWVDKETLPQLDLAYDMLELLRMMEDEELSEYYYHERIEAGWRKSMY